ncbi:hypothetical protein, partial [Cupriavidus sp. SK-4]|uniref:hypothetical protein n=1 Tax=Cupriavidus sp. SK-4 TaxID=574750 RepID=UPI0012679707
MIALKWGSRRKPSCIATDAAQYCFTSGGFISRIPLSLHGQGDVMNFAKLAALMIAGGVMCGTAQAAEQL